MKLHHLDGEFEALSGIQFDCFRADADNGRACLMRDARPGRCHVSFSQTVDPDKAGLSADFEVFTPK